MDLNKEGSCRKGHVIETILLVKLQLVLDLCSEFPQVYLCFFYSLR